jgi:hypothetical protein
MGVRRRTKALLRPRLAMQPLQAPSSNYRATQDLQLKQIPDPDSTDHLAGQAGPLQYIHDS